MGEKQFFLFCLEIFINYSLGGIFMNHQNHRTLFALLLTVFLLAANVFSGAKLRVLADTQNTPFSIHGAL